MNFKAHLNILQKDLSYKTYLLSKLRYSLTEDATLDIIKSRILSVLDYGQLIYGAGDKGSLDRLQGILNRILRLCFFQERNANIEHIRKTAGINTLQERRDKALTFASYTYAQEEGHIDGRQIYTRWHDARLVNVTWYTTKKAQQSVTYRCAHKWNSLDIDIRASNTPIVFKTKVNAIYKALLD